MILIKKSPLASKSFRTAQGSYNATNKDGYLVIKVDSSVAARHLMIRHKFVPAPAGFGVEKKTAPAPKPKAKPASKKSAPKKSAPKKTVSNKK